MSCNSGRQFVPYVAADPESYIGKSVGDGQCVAFVKAAAGAPVTSAWRVGTLVKGAVLAKGTAIATFDANGLYANAPTGNHAAIYLSQDAAGIQVLDQWVSPGKPPHAVSARTIRFQGGAAGVSASNNGDLFSVIE